MIHEDITYFIIYLAINKSANLFLNHLSQVMTINFDMLHLTMCNKIIINLNCTCIVTMCNSQGLDRKPDLSREIMNPNGLSTYIMCTRILSFHSQQRNYLLFHGWPDQCARTKMKDNSKSGFLIITITFLAKVGVPDQQIWMLTLFDTKLRYTLQIMNNSLCIFLVAFSRILHEARDHTNNKGNL